MQFHVVLPIQGILGTRLDTAWNCQLGVSRAYLACLQLPADPCTPDDAGLPPGFSGSASGTAMNLAMSKVRVWMVCMRLKASLDCHEGGQQCGVPAPQAGLSAGAAGLLECMLRRASFASCLFSTLQGAAPGVHSVSSSSLCRHADERS